jgi:hypothetical protein
MQRGFLAIDLDQGAAWRRSATKNPDPTGANAMPIHVVLVISAVSAAFIAFAIALGWAEHRTRKR